jgi:uncharacterized Zn-finger protein
LEIFNFFARGKEAPLSHPRVFPTTYKKKLIICSNVVGLIGPGVFRGNCPLGNFKGRYAGRIGRHNWKSLNLSPVVKKVPLSHPRVFPKCEPQTGSSLFLEAIFKEKLVEDKL